MNHTALELIIHFKQSNGDSTENCTTEPVHTNHTKKQNKNIKTIVDARLLFDDFRYKFFNCSEILPQFSTGTSLQIESANSKHKLRHQCKE